MDNSLLDPLLDLEEKLYKEGYDLGVSDGIESGYTEGSVFAVEKGFEKFLEIGRLYGKALVWAHRLVDSDPSQNRVIGDKTKEECPAPNGKAIEGLYFSSGPSAFSGMPSFPQSSRLAKNIYILLELVDPATLAMENTEDAVSDTEERLKGALIKAKLIQRVLGEREDTSDIHPDARETATGDGTGSIEDISSLAIRH